MIPLSKQELESKLWQAADILSGEINTTDYKSYIFSLMFLKRLSDRFDEEVEQAAASGAPRKAALSEPGGHEFFVPEEARWAVLISPSMSLGKRLNKAGKIIEAENRPRLDGIMTGVNWDDESKLGDLINRERVIRSMLNHFSDLDLSNRNLYGEGRGTSNVLGEAYEYLIHQFAEDAGRKGGKFYTPRGVVNLMIELLRPEEGMSVCDPTAGSGGMLIYAAQYVEKQGGDPRNLTLHGQERNPGALAHGRLNLLLHNLRSARLESGDVITEPQLLDEEGKLLTYDRVIANPPFSLRNWGHETARKDPHSRFNRYKTLPPRNKADLAFLMHMLAVAEPNGMVGAVMPQGGLHRGGAEAKIRRRMVQADLFEAIIGLAPDLFFGINVPAAICVLNKDKPPERRGKVLIINAAQEGYFRKRGSKVYLDKQHIDKIAALYHAFKEVERFARVADLNKIKSNDYDLSISRYIDTTERMESYSRSYYT